MKFIFNFLLLFIISFLLYSQDNTVNPNGYNKFYYGNGAISSEGLMIDGKPDGFWKTYFINGKVKSEGNRRNMLLDSTWNFYEENGIIEKVINYLYGKKNGYYYTYSAKNTDSTRAGILVSKELYVDDIKQGLSYMYYSDGKLYKIIPYKDGKKDGIAKEFSRDSIIITLTEYYKDYFIDREKINRKDKSGRKQGVWKEFYPNDKVKTESLYFNDMLTGYYREYDSKGNITKEIKFEKGIEVNDTVSVQKVFIKNAYYDNGRLKYSGSFRDSIPVGIHREYSENEEVVKAFEYNERGKKIGEGIADKIGLKQGKWRHLFEDGTLQSLGEYKDNKRIGNWTFYFNNGNIEQTGRYNNGKPDGLWKWFYKDGKIWREENYVNGREEGLFIEYNEDGTVITKGEYADGEKEGSWFANVGDYREEGNYKNGLQEGLWKWFYQDGTLQFEGRFIEGEPEGEHKFYFEDGRLKLSGKYLMGKKEGNWRRFDEQGNQEIVFTYKAGKEIRVDGMKWRWPEEEKKNKR